MIYLAAALSLALFVWSLRRCGAVESAGSAVGMARTAFATLRDATLSDDEKERAARAFSARLLVQGVAVLGRLALALALPLGFLLLLLIGGLVSVAALVALLDSWTFLIVSTAAVGVALFWRR